LEVIPQLGTIDICDLIANAELTLTQRYRSAAMTYTFLMKESVEPLCGL
jgi:hypothetical protein